jgi:peptidoglycan/LPS O-acetylase OafA/YrhL
VTEIVCQAYSKFREVRYFGSLDGLRGFSILGVVWFHTWYVTAYYPVLQTIPVLHLGEFGVHVFFGISGFLITTLLLREQDRYGSISLRDFYIRRALRIWPVYYATLAFYVVLVLVTESSTDRGRLFFHYLPGYLTYTFTWFAGSATSGVIFNFAWSLATEEQFYCFWPAAVRFLRNWSAALVMFVLIGAHVGVRYGLLANLLPGGSLLDRMVWSIAVPICLGSLLAQALHTPSGFQMFYPILGKTWSAPATAALLLSSLAPREPIWPLAWLAVALLVGACVIREDNGLAPLLRFRPLAFIGVVSYGMYLFNSLIVRAVHMAMDRVGLGHPLLALPFTVGLTVLAAFLSYRYFEMPFLAQKERFSRKPRTTDAEPRQNLAPPVSEEVAVVSTNS